MKLRMYPTACTSAFCGLLPEDCGGCPNEPAKKDFYAWRERTNATRPDPIWSPTVWEAGDES